MAKSAHTRKESGIDLGVPSPFADAMSANTELDWTMSLVPVKPAWFKVPYDIQR
jgi:hypothetical protein